MSFEESSEYTGYTSGSGSSSNTTSNTSTDNPIFSTGELRRIAEDMKNDLDTVLKNMEDTIKFAQEERNKLSTIKSALLEKEDQVKNASEELEDAEQKIIKNESIAAKAEKDLSTLKNAMDGIREITAELEPSEADKALSSLKGSFIKRQTDVDKAKGELNSAIKIKNLATKKLEEVERAYEEEKKRYSDQVAKTELLTENVEKSISHIVKTYNDVIGTAKDLLIANLDTQQPRIPPDSGSEQVSFTQNQTETEQKDESRKEQGNEEPLAT